MTQQQIYQQAYLEALHEACGGNQQKMATVLQVKVAGGNAFGEIPAYADDLARALTGTADTANAAVSTGAAAAAQSAKGLPWHSRAAQKVWDFVKANPKKSLLAGAALTEEGIRNAPYALGSDTPLYKAPHKLLGDTYNELIGNTAVATSGAAADKMENATRNMRLGRAAGGAAEGALAGGATSALLGGNVGRTALISALLGGGVQAATDYQPARQWAAENLGLTDERIKSLGLKDWSGLAHAGKIGLPVIAALVDRMVSK